MKYSIVIPSYNSETTIVPCLQAITQQRFDEAYEVIVVDSSADATPEIIRQKFPQVTLIHFEEQTDDGTARNIGIQNARGDIICLIDSDCIADPDWLRLIAAAHKSGEYAAVGGSLLNANPEKLVGWASYLASFREFFPFQPKHVVPHIASGNLSYKRWVFERHGPFTQDYYPQSDLVFNIQLSGSGEKLLFDPAIKVAHINKNSLKGFLIGQYRVGRITSIVLKHYPSLHGHFIARSRILTILAIPLLPCIKFINTFRVAMRSTEYLWYFLLTSPLLAMGLFVWGIGFVRGAFLPKGHSPN